MEWLQLGPTSFGGFVFTIWFIGVIGGYCAGRAHSTWITMRNFMKAHG